MFNRIIKKKTVIISAICVVLITCVGIVGANNLSKSEKRTLYDNLTKEFDMEKNKLDEMGEPKNNKEAEEKTKKAEELKQKGIEITRLSDEVKTQEEFSKELKSALTNIKRGIEDTKIENNAKTNPKVKSFIEKSEKKITRIEKEFAEGNKTPEQLLKELLDRTDVDN